MAFVVALACFSWVVETAAKERELPTTEGRPDHRQSADLHGDPPDIEPEDPALPEGMSLDDVLDRASQPPPEHFPEAVPDDALRYFLLFEQLEYRLREGGKDELGWEGQGWLGFDYDKLWVKLEGESVFDGPDEGESEIDLLYSRLVTPFWNAQLGVQYANEWHEGEGEDRWSAVLGFQGLAPGMFELDSSLYVSEYGDFTAEIEAEYDVRLTQRVVLQPRVELTFSGQEVPEREIGAGMADAVLDLRLRYEAKREIAPYVGIRYRVLVGDTADLAQASGREDDAFFGSAGLRLAF
jgi:copper resistance protein B